MLGYQPKRYRTVANVRTRSREERRLPRPHERVQTGVERNRNLVASRGSHDRSGDCIDFRSTVPVQVLEHARPVRGGPLRDEERAMSQLLFIDMRAFGLRDRGRLAAHILDEAQKALVPYEPPV